jgi:cytochrome c2
MHTKFMAAILVLALAPFAWPIPAPAQITIIPGSSVGGAALVRQKGCVACHDFDGAARGRTPAQLAAALWNHSPEMWRAQKERNVRPTLNSMEAADLFAYFFSLSYSAAPGNAMKGQAVFETKNCAGCHDAAIGQRRSGPPISTWNKVNDPLAWAELMWNHSNKVYVELANTGVPFPQFSAEEMVDMLAYLRSVPESSSHGAGFQPGDPEKGRMTFERTCEECHSFGSNTAQPKIDLLKRPAPDLMAGYVVAMWNHAPLMHQRAGDSFPILGPGDMSNLVAYLFAQRYFYGEGDAARGAKVFQTKSCATCHEKQRRQTGAPDLTTAPERYSPITISAAVFRHGSAMLDTMQKNNVRWPQFTAGEMSDLIAYLNSRLVIRLAGE